MTQSLRRVDITLLEATPACGTASGKSQREPDGTRGGKEVASVRLGPPLSREGGQPLRSSRKTKSPQSTGILFILETLTGTFFCFMYGVHRYFFIVVKGPLRRKYVPGTKKTSKRTSKRQSKPNKTHVSRSYSSSTAVPEPKQLRAESGASYV